MLRENYFESAKIFVEETGLKVGYLCKMWWCRTSLI
jgi:hypothetical protein